MSSNEKIYLKYEKDGEQTSESSQGKDKKQKIINYIAIFAVIVLSLFIVKDFFFKEEPLGSINIEEKIKEQQQQIDNSKIQEKEEQLKNIEELVLYDFYIIGMFNEVVGVTQEYLNLRINYPLYIKETGRIKSEVTSVNVTADNIFYNILDLRIRNLQQLSIELEANVKAGRSSSQLVSLINGYLEVERVLKNEQNEFVLSFIQNSHLDYHLDEKNNVIIAK